LCASVLSLWITSSFGARVGKLATWTLPYPCRQSSAPSWRTCHLSCHQLRWTLVQWWGAGSWQASSGRGLYCCHVLWPALPAPPSLLWAQMQTEHIHRICCLHPHTPGLWSFFRASRVGHFSLALNAKGGSYMRGGG
jgi:hypothetical protein